MATYQVELADGSIYEIEADEAPAQPEQTPSIAQGFEGNLQRAREQLVPGDTFDNVEVMPQSNRGQVAGQFAKTLGSAAIAEPAAGIAGAATSIFAGSEAGTDVINSVRQSLTAPLGQEATQALQGGIQSLPPALINTLEAAGKKYSNFADMAAELLGPAAGAAVKTAPVAAAELLGAKGASMVLRRSNASLAMSQGRLAKELNELAPSVDELSAASSALFKEVDRSGAFVSAQETRIAALKAKKALISITGEKQRRAPAIWKEVNDMIDAGAGGRGFPVDELMRVRTQLATIAGNRTDNQAVAARAVLDSVDETLDGLTVAKLSGNKAVNVGENLKTARELWRRSKRAGAVEKAVEEARQARSGFENGIRNEFGKLRRGKDFKFFTKQEQELIRQVERGGITENSLKKLGRFGPGEGASTSMTAMTAGSAAGFLAGGPAGAVAVPLIGAVSRGLAAKLTRANAQFALDVIKSGSDSRRIVSSYMTHVPAGKRSAQELKQLLMNPQINLTNLKPGGQPLISEARLSAMADRARIAQQAAAAATGSAASSPELQ